VDINIESNENGVRRSINVRAVEDRILVANMGKGKKRIYTILNDERIV